MIPAELLDLNRWVGWRYEQRGAKMTKIPVTPDGQHLASCDDPQTWGAFHEITGDARGFQLGDGIVGIDIDSCRDPETGDLSVGAQAIIDQIKSYTEISPSGRGIHILLKGELPPGRRRLGSIEMYALGRFFTITGEHLEGTPEGLEERGSELAGLHRELFPETAPVAPEPRLIVVELDDEDLIQRAIAAHNGAKFAGLWRGDFNGYTSASEADLAFCGMLAFWTGGDEARIERLWLRSGLFREKAQREDYRRRTIEKALSGKTEFYSPTPKMATRRSLPQPSPTTGQGIGRLLSQVSHKSVDWLWLHHLPLGALCVLDGDPELGKSTLSYDWAARVTTGRPWPDGTPVVEGGVVVIAGEDSLEHVIAPRLKAAGADLDRVLHIGSIPSKEGPRLLQLPDDIELIELQAIRRMNAKLLIFDPIMPYIHSGLNANRDGDVRRALTPLAEALERTACTGIMLRHLNKDSKTDNALYRGLNSIAFIALSRAGFAVAKDPDEHGSMIFAMTKSNLGPKPSSLRYKIEQVNLGPDDRGKDIVTSRIQWLGESDKSATTLITAFGKDAPRKTAEALLTEMVLETGECSSQEIFDAAREAQISKSTLIRAKEQMGIKAKREGYGGQGEWFWYVKRPENGDFSVQRMSHHQRNSQNLASFDDLNSEAQRSSNPQFDILWHPLDPQTSKDANSGSLPARERQKPLNSSDSISDILRLVSDVSEEEDATPPQA